MAETCFVEGENFGMDARLREWGDGVGRECGSDWARGGRLKGPYLHPTGRLGSDVGLDGQVAKCRKLRGKAGAGERTRTADLLITNQLLYQLSYAGTGGKRGLAGTSGGGHPSVSESRTGRRGEPGCPRRDDAGTAVGSPSLPPYCSWLRCGVHDRRGSPSLAGSVGGWDGPRRLGRRRRGHGDGCGRASRWHWTQLSTMVM